MDKALVKLKGDGQSHHSQAMMRALGANKPEAPKTDARGGRGDLNEGALPKPSMRDQMPSVKREKALLRERQIANAGGPKDWSAASNRISMGGPIYMRSKTNVDDEYEDRDHEEEERKSSAIGDALVAGNLSRAKATAGGSGPAAGADEDDEDDEFADEDSGVVAQWRAARMAELAKTTAKTNQFLGLGHGSYTEITQDDFLKEVTKSKYCVVHFYHPEFERCKLIDRHLEPLARKHLATKWMKLDANKAPFFVTKLQIRMLPTLVFFKDGIARDRLVGLDDLGAKDEFTTSELEARIAKAGVIITGDKKDLEEQDAARKTAHSIRQSKHNQADSSDDDD
jgi:thiol-disulfide isomerase/thioredoxin